MILLYQISTKYNNIYGSICVEINKYKEEKYEK